MMNILIITDPYPPQLYSISLMMQQLAEELSEKGNEVTVATPWPRHNVAPEAKRMVYRESSVEKGVHVIRVKTLPLHNVNFLIRGISQLLLPHLFLAKIKKHCRNRFDLVIVYSPPLPFATLGQRIKKTLGGRYVLNIQDIFPQSAIDLGIMNNKLLIKFFERMENKAYRQADEITSHTITSRKFLIEKKNVPPHKIHYIPNWIDIQPYLNATKPQHFRRELGLNDRFIFLFAGVMGPSQGLDLIIKAANEVKSTKEICFLFLGDGMEKQSLMKLAADHSLENVIFHPFVSQERYSELAKEVDVGLICLSNLNKTPVVPGKLLGYMAASLPVVALLNEESDGHALIAESNCGYSLVSDATPEEVGKTLHRIFAEKDRLPQFGQNVYRYVSEHFSKGVCIENLVRLLTD